MQGPLTRPLDAMPTLGAQTRVSLNLHMGRSVRMDSLALAPRGWVPCALRGDQVSCTEPWAFVAVGQESLQPFLPQNLACPLSYFPAPGEKTAGEKAGGLSSQNIPNRAAGI